MTLPQAWRGESLDTVGDNHLPQLSLPFLLRSGRSRIIIMTISGKVELYSTTPRNGNRVNGNHLDQSFSFFQKNGNSLTWVLVALTVCFTYPVLYRVSSESRACEWEL